MRSPLTAPEGSETPAELRRKAERYRKLARDFPGEMGKSILEMASEFDALAAAREAGESPSSDR